MRLVVSSKPCFNYTSIIFSKCFNQVVLCYLLTISIESFCISVAFDKASIPIFHCHHMSPPHFSPTRFFQEFPKLPCKLGHRSAVWGRKENRGRSRGVVMQGTFAALFNTKGSSFYIKTSKGHGYSPQPCIYLLHVKCLQEPITVYSFSFSDRTDFSALLQTPPSFIYSQQASAVYTHQLNLIMEMREQCYLFVYLLTPKPWRILRNTFY